MVQTFNPKRAITDLSNKSINRFLSVYNIEIDEDMFKSLSLKWNPKSLIAAAWMKYYFNLVGDNVPDSKGEIHLEAIPKQDIYAEYVYDIELMKDSETHVCIDTFLELWRNVYPHVLSS